MQREITCGWLLAVLAGFGASLAAEPDAASVPPGAVLVEAERFDDYGGWVDDSQFMDQMGSPFLLAHGLGQPVRDATTEIRTLAAGRYRLWVRTRDWVAPWQAPGAPGRFQVVINGTALPVTFGTTGAAWHWQDGGLVDLAGAPVDLALRDLTGFDGRCDALLFIPAEAGCEPPSAPGPLARWRHALAPHRGQIQDAGQYDLAVVGGGIAGTCAAISAARQGLRVVLIQDRPVLGGNNSSEVRVWLHGARNLPPFPHIGDIVAELEQSRRAHYGPANTAEIYEDERKLELVRNEQNIDLRLLHRANGVEMDGQRIQAVLAEHTRSGQRFRFRATLVADCTGDGCVGHLAGADAEMTVPGHMGRCNLWHVVDTGQPQPFPRCPWALDLADQPFPGRQPLSTRSLGAWYWESGFDHDPIQNSELIRDWNLRAAFGAWDALKNTDGVLPNYRLAWVAYVSGKRESRRLLGDVVLSKEDLLTGRQYADGCVPTGWKIDVHIPDPRYDRAFPGNAFISKALYTDYPQPYWIPYRCLYSRNIDNLFMAGRDISVTHEALGATRVMRTGGCMGEVVGLAAAICVEQRTCPRGVWQDHADTFRTRLRKPPYGRPGSRLPPQLAGQVGPNVAPAAELRVSGRHEPTYDPQYLCDGYADTRVNPWRWISNEAAEPWVEFVWEQPANIVAAWIVSGYRAGGQVTGVLEDFVLQHHDGTTWRDIEGSRVQGNTEPHVIRRFAPVQTRRFRLLVTRTPDNLARVWEVQLFADAE